MDPDKINACTLRLPTYEQSPRCQNVVWGVGPLAGVHGVQLIAPRFWGRHHVPASGLLWPSVQTDWRWWARLYTPTGPVWRGTESPPGPIRIGFKHGHRIQKPGRPRHTQSAPPELEYKSIVPWPAGPFSTSLACASTPAMAAGTTVSTLCPDTISNRCHVSITVRDSRTVTGPFQGPGVSLGANNPASMPPGFCALSVRNPRTVATRV